jgi:hypothetical protein
VIEIRCGFLNWIGIAEIRWAEWMATPASYATRLHFRRNFSAEWLIYSGCDWMRRIMQLLHGLSEGC